MMRSDHSRPTPRQTTELADPLSVVLSAPRRHRALRALATDGDDATSFDDLVVAVTAFERVSAIGDEPKETSDEVAISLHHCHLPKLAGAGIVEAVGDDGVRLTERGRKCARALDMDTSTA